MRNRTNIDKRITLRGLRITPEDGSAFVIPWPDIIVPHNDKLFRYSPAAKRQWPRLHFGFTVKRPRTRLLIKKLVRRAVRQRDYRQVWRQQTPLRYLSTLFAVCAMLFVALVFCESEANWKLHTAILTPSQMLPGQPFEYQVLLAITAAVLPALLLTPVVFLIWRHRFHLLQIVPRRRVRGVVTYPGRIEIEHAEGLVESIEPDKLHDRDSTLVWSDAKNRYVALWPEALDQWHAYVRAALPPTTQIGLSIGTKLRITLILLTSPFLFGYLAGRLPPLDGYAFPASELVAPLLGIFGFATLLVWLPTVFRSIAGHKHLAAFLSRSSTSPTPKRSHAQTPHN